MNQTWSDIGIHIPPGRFNGDIKVPCPECIGQGRNPRDKCLSANLDNGVWLCHKCEWSGVLKTDRPLPMRPSVRIASPPVTPIPPAFSQIGERGLGWFAKRGISEQIVQRFGIYTEKRYFPGAESELPALCFPYTVGGELVNVKYRAATEKHFTMVKGARKTFFNLDAVRDTERVLIVEGEMDVLALAACGIANAISVPNGANSLTDEVMDSAAFLAENKSVRFVLAGDNDDKGRALESELARRFGRERCSRVAWPDGCKDANDALMQRGADAVRAAVKGATPYPVEGVFTANQFEQELWTLYADGMPRGTMTGWTAMRDLYSVRPGEMTVVTGAPGSGKSAWVDQLTVNLAETEEWRFAVYSPENQPIYRHVAGLIAKHVGAPFGEGPTPRMDAGEMDAGRAWVDAHYGFILPETPTLGEVLERARVLVYRMGVRGLILDPWNEMDHSRPPGLTETEYISQSLTRIRQFARDNGVHVWIVVHPVKLVKESNGNYPVPTLYDCAGSAHWHNKADNGISIWRDKGSPGSPVDIHIQKIRFAEVGQLGVASLHYDPPTGRFLDLAGGGAVRYGGGA